MSEEKKPVEGLELTDQEMEQASGGSGGSSDRYCCSCGWSGHFSSSAEAQEAHDSACPNCTKKVKVRNFRGGTRSEPLGYL